MNDDWEIMWNRLEYELMLENNTEYQEWLKENSSLINEIHICMATGKPIKQKTDFRITELRKCLL